MKAIVYARYGDPDVLQLTEWPAPQPGPGQALIDVAAVAVAPGDCKTRAGALHHFHPQTFPKIPGRSGVGTVVAFGDAAAAAPKPVGAGDALQVGDRVFFSTPHTGQGCSAEQIVVDAASLARVPPGLDAVDVAAIAHAAVCAWRGLIDHADVQSGQSVLIVGGSGVVGLAAIELAAHLGARVTTTGSLRRVDDMRRAGAAFVWSPDALHALADANASSGGIAVAQDGTAAAVDAPAATERFDCVFDLIGGQTHRLASRLVAPGGAIAYLRAEALPEDCPDGIVGVSMSDGGATCNAGTVETATRTVIDVRYTPALVTQVLDCVARGVLTPRVALAVPLAACALAHRRVEAGRLDGRVVLRIPG